MHASTGKLGSSCVDRETGSSCVDRETGSSCVDRETGSSCVDRETGSSCVASRCSLGLSCWFSCHTSSSCLLLQRSLRTLLTPVYVQQIRPGCETPQDDTGTSSSSSDECCSRSGFLAGNDENTFKSEITITESDLMDSCSYPDQKVLGGSITFSSRSPDSDSKRLNISCALAGSLRDCSGCTEFDLIAPPAMKFIISPAGRTYNWNGVSDNTLKVYNVFELKGRQSIRTKKDKNYQQWFLSLRSLQYGPFVSATSQTNHIRFAAFRDDIGRTDFSINFEVVPDFKRQLEVVCLSSSHGTNSDYA